MPRLSRGNRQSQRFDPPSGELPDYPPLSEIGPCFSQRTVETLKPWLLDNGRLFPLLTRNEVFFAYHVDTVLTALDEGSSEFERFPTGEVFLITKHVFRNEMIETATIFSLPTKRGSAVYVTKRFVDTAEEHGLTGFKFFLVWDGERPVTGSGLLGRGW